MSSATTYESTSTGHMCDMDRCVERTSLSIRNFGRRFYGCQQWAPDSDQACKFFKWLDKNTCPRGRATAPLVHERFARYKADAVAARNERDEAYAREAEAWELLRKAKRKGEKSNLKLRIAEDKVYKYRVALFLSCTVFGVYFVFSNVFGGHCHTQLRLP
ncbi:hypothetical protein CFP56_043852 [Quercus suber]|uniref:GRF-type domain-containing protein n=1 Tax=Quercus suber TaxID=58331 RepID=A0AAW0LGL6_QUESU|nr:uncharacterized protein LOC111994489 [Quercus suber]XP_023904929.1 uncharacterized protein LOC112016632 [Quercus suber]POE73504.1 hypothetical protein CFP56_33926 [Quercus suber]